MGIEDSAWVDAALGQECCCPLGVWAVGVQPGNVEGDGELVNLDQALR